MHRLQALNLGQRAVLVVALAGVLRTVGSYMIGTRSGEWFSYAPNSGVAFSPDVGMDRLPAAVLWTILTALWAAASVWLLGLARRSDG